MWHMRGFTRRRSRLFSRQAAWMPHRSPSSGCMKEKTQRFRGRRVRLRLLETGLNNGPSSTDYQVTFMHNPDPGDDGWWVDDMEIDDALSSPATVVNDDKTHPGPADECATSCNTLQAFVSVDPGTQLAAPGQTITLKPRIHKLARENMESMAGHIVPGWMEVNPAELSIKITGPATADQIPFDVNTNLIVEFYR